MTALRDPFANVHKKDIKNKSGQVVAQVDYVGWSQVADRLDDVDPSWSFEVVNLGPDWCLGSLRIGDRTFQNVGYAENAEMDWKKEPLKDAVSDAFKRCAALAGVARYLYDKDQPRQNGAHRPAVSARIPESRLATAPAASVPDDPYADLPNDWDKSLPPVTPAAAVGQSVAAALPDPRDGYYGDTCPVHTGRPWKETSRGIKCTANDGTRDNPDWCTWKPSKRWIAEHETVPA